MSKYNINKEKIVDIDTDIYIYLYNGKSFYRKLANLLSIVRSRLDLRQGVGQIVYIYCLKSEKIYLYRGGKFPIFDTYKEFAEYYRDYTIAFSTKK
jgi:hypothetical protein